jgi:hypothetical protein
VIVSSLVLESLKVAVIDSLWYTLAVLDSRFCPAVSCVRPLLPLLLPTLLREKSNRPQSRRVRRGTEERCSPCAALRATRPPAAVPPRRRRRRQTPGGAACAARCRRAEEIPRVDVTRGQGAFRCIEHESEAPGRCRGAVGVGRGHPAVE